MREAVDKERAFRTNAEEAVALLNGEVGRLTGEVARLETEKGHPETEKGRTTRHVARLEADLCRIRGERDHYRHDLEQNKVLRREAQVEAAASKAAALSSKLEMEAMKSPKHSEWIGDYNVFTNIELGFGVTKTDTGRGVLLAEGRDGSRFAFKRLATKLMFAHREIACNRDALAQGDITLDHVVFVHARLRGEDHVYMAMSLTTPLNTYVHKLYPEPAGRPNHSGSLQFKLVVRVAAELFECVARLHAIGWVHRDIKPENIGINQTPDGDFTLRLFDLGLAARICMEDNTHSIVTKPYRPPEAWASDDDVGVKPVEGRVYAGGYGVHGVPVDAWSAACVVAELFSLGFRTGRWLPDEKDDLNVLLQAWKAAAFKHEHLRLARAAAEIEAELRRRMTAAMSSFVLSNLVDLTEFVEIVLGLLRVDASQRTLVAEAGARFRALLGRLLAG